MYTEVNLVNDPSYRCSVTCFGRSLTINITWIERLKKRAITITNSEGISYLQNTIINVDEELKLNSNAINDGFPYKIMIQYIPEMDQKEDYLNWANNMMMNIFATISEEN